MSTENEKLGREETVVPVSEPLERFEPGKLPSARDERRSPAPLIVAALLAVLVLVVFLALPDWVADRQEELEEAAPAAEVAPPAPAEPALSPEELAALEEQAESLLANVLEQQTELGARSAASWGGQRWLDYEAQARLGDTTFLADEFADSIEHYQQALRLGEALIAQSDDIMAAALIAGDEAVAAGDAALAAEQYAIVIGVDPENARALAGQARAERLPDVLELTSRGDAARQAGDGQRAVEAYRAALAIDPDWAPAESALAEVTTELANARFDRLLSEGFAAIAAEDYDDAETAFRQALAVRPGSEAARDGLEQAEQGQKLDAIALAEIRALAFERRELWDEAIARYEAALETDATLEFAIEGLERAQARADLDRKLENLIANPNLLLTESVLSDAEFLLEQARPYAEPETRIAGQVDRLGALVKAATTPVVVELESDELTEVTVYRVGNLGAFATRAVELRPGTYTAVGSRKGYRDVRTSFTVLPGRTLQPIRIVCVEPI